MWPTSLGAVHEGAREEVSNRLQLLLWVLERPKLRAIRLVTRNRRMDTSSLFISVLACGSGSLVFLISFIVFNRLWHDFRRVDEEPRWLSTKILVALNVLRLKKSFEIPHKKAFGEKCMAAISTAYILLGLANFAAGVYSVNFVGAIRDATCDYAEEMGHRCKIASCPAQCGTKNFDMCGPLSCDSARCRANLMVYFITAGDSASKDAAEHFQRYQNELAVVQGIASIFGTITSLMFLAVPSLLAGFRTDGSALAISGYVATVCAPIYFILAAMVIIYGLPIRKVCDSWTDAEAQKCSSGLGAGFFFYLCEPLGTVATDSCTLAISLSAAALAAEGILSCVTAVLANRYRATYFVVAAYRMDVESIARNRGLIFAQETDASPHRRLGMRMVTDDDYLRVPGLLQLYRGHQGAVLCAYLVVLDLGDCDDADAESAQKERLLTGSSDGTIRVWDVVEGSCLRVWKTPGPVSALCVHNGKGPARAQRRQRIVAMTNGRAEWSDQDGVFFPDVPVDDSVVWVRVFRARLDHFRLAHSRARKGGGADVEAPAEATDKDLADGRSDMYTPELIGGCYFSLKAALKVVTRGKNGVFAQDWWHLRDCRRKRFLPRQGRPGSHFEDDCDEVPARTGRVFSSDDMANKDRRAGFRSPGDVLVKVEVQNEDPSSESGGGGGGGGGGESARSRLFVAVREVALSSVGKKRGHRTPIFCLIDVQEAATQRVFSAHKTVVTAWDPRTGQAVGVFPRSRPPHAVEGHTRRVSCLVAARLGRRDRLFSGSMDHDVRVWDMHTGDCLAVLRGHVDTVLCLSIWQVDSEEVQIVEAGALPEEALLWVSADLRVMEAGNGESTFDVNIQLIKALGLPAMERSGGCNIIIRGEAAGEVPLTKKGLHFHPRSRSPQLDECMRFKELDRADEIVLKVFSRGRSGRSRYVGCCVLPVSQIYMSSLPSDMLGDAKSSTAEGGEELEQGEVGAEGGKEGRKGGELRVMTERQLVIDHQVRRTADVYSGGGPSDCRVLRWDLDTSTVVRSYPRSPESDLLRAPDLREGHAGAVTAVVATVFNGNRRLFTSSLDGSIRIWDPKSGNRLKVMRFQAEITSLAVGIMTDGSMHTFAGLTDGSAVMMKVSAAAIAKDNWRRRLMKLLDKPSAFGLVGVAILLDLSAGLSEMTASDSVKDCFGRQNPINSVITLTVLSIFVVELLGRIVAWGSRFWSPLREARWNYFEVGIITISVSIAIYQTIVDFTMADLPPEAYGSGGLYPVITPAAYPALCAPNATVQDNGGGPSASSATATARGGGGTTTSAVQKGLTTLRIVSRVAVGLRLLRIAVKASRIAHSLLGRNKPTFFDAHEKGLHAVCLGRLRGETAMVTACDDGFARLWDPTGLILTLRGDVRPPWWRRWLGLDG